MATTPRGKRGKYHKITTSEKKLILEASDAADYLVKFRGAFPRSKRTDSSIKSIFNNRKKILPESGSEPAPVKFETESGDANEVPQQRGQILDVEKQLAVRSKDFETFEKRHRERFPTSTRSSGSLYSMYGKRKQWKKDFGPNAKPAAPAIRQLTEQGSPDQESKDLLNYIHELKQEQAEIKTTLVEILAVLKEGVELQKKTITKKKKGDRASA